jgi:hypothetical protein
MSGVVPLAPTPLVVPTLAIRFSEKPSLAAVLVTVIGTAPLPPTWKMSGVDGAAADAVASR